MNTKNERLLSLLIVLGIGVNLLVFFLVFELGERFGKFLATWL
jgi:hypothetical protein